MCGVVGVVGVNDPAVILRMAGVLGHRGPDRTAVFSSGTCHLGASRLSIVDLQAGHQPMLDNSDGRCIVFNGEIYNAGALRRTLERCGYGFRSRSDTEVVLYAFKEWGPSCVDRLSGMYSLAILDGTSVFLARDPLGIKPLYYSQTSGGTAVLFASEIKALFASRLIDPSLRVQALADHVALGFLTAKDTFFEGIDSFPVGQVVEVSAANSTMKLDTVHRSLRSRRSVSLSFADAVDCLDVCLSNAVRSHVEADVPVALTLSGGLDSALLAFYMRQHCARDLQFFTIGDADNHPDIAGSRAIAAALGVRHSIIKPTPSDALSVISQCVLADEQPCSLAAHGPFLLFRGVSSSFRACLNGEGADELFGGYREYMSPNAWAQTVLPRVQHVKSAGFSLSETAEVIVERIAQASTLPSSYLDAVFDVNMADQLTRRHLERIDKYSMAHSVEVRVPYLDEEVVSLAVGLPVEFKVDLKKSAQKKVLADLARKKLPRSVLMTLPKRKVGLPGAGRRSASLLGSVLDELALLLKEKHPFGSLLHAGRDLLMYDLFEEIWMRRRGSVEADFDTAEFFEERLAVVHGTLRTKLSGAMLVS